MRVLALDTTTSAGSVALVEDDWLVAERLGDSSRPHAERLPGDLVRVLDTAHVHSSGVDIFAVAAGPGSFTGIRIGIATMQGLAFVNRRPVVAVSSLEALAQIGSQDLQSGSLVAAWVDAHRREVRLYRAVYEVTDAPIFSPDRMLEIDPPRVEDPASALSRWTDRFPRVEVFVGDGAAPYRNLIAADTHVPPPPLLAGAIGRIAVARARGGRGRLLLAGVQPFLCPPAGCRDGARARLAAMDGDGWSVSER